MWRRLPKHSTSVGLATCLILATSLLPVTAGAVSSSNYAAYPTGQQDSSTPWFTYALAPGQGTNNTITIVNKSASPTQFSVYPVDAAIGNQNAFTMLAANSPKQDVGSWLKLSVSQLTIPAHAERPVSFQFAVPTGAAVGPHYGGIIVQPSTTTSAQTGQTNVTIVSRLGVRIYETVPGTQAPRLRIDSFKHQLSGTRLKITAILHNEGNTVLTPRGELQVKNTFGKLISATAISSDLIPVGGSTDLSVNVTLPHSLPGRLTTSLALSYANNKSTSKKISFWSDERWVLLFGTVDVVVILLIWRAFRK